MTTIFQARKILTMNPGRPLATHVAVRDGRILGAGSLDELKGWGDHQLDTTFADKILMPGLVEGHSHVSEGVQWRFVYCGYFDRTDPDGKTWSGLKSVEAVIERLSEANAGLTDPKQPLTGWSLDPIYFDNRRVTRHDLDRVSTDRPIGIMHASGHIMNVNTRALELAGMLRSLNHPGVPLGADGLPTGEMKGPDAMTPLGPHVGLDRGLLASDEQGLRAFARLCVRKGVTTAADLANLLLPAAVDMMLRVTAEKSFPARIVSLRVAREITPAALVERCVELKKLSIDRLRLGTIKIVVDGSIQGFSARLRAPGYYNGAPNGLWYVAPEQLRDIFDRALTAGVRVHCHTNGDEATELVLDTLEQVLRQHPSPDHRFTLQHCQLANAAQFRRMKVLGMCVNLFPNHHYYWGDQHYALTVGPERAERMNACATALANGVPMAIHSDAPVTPLGPLFTAWCAVNRLTASGRTLGAAEQISVVDALRTITLGAAYTFGLDGEIGSIEAGKLADFAVLEDDPSEIGGDKLKDVRIWGTVQGGRLFSCRDDMNARRLPVTLIGGYLGAGKTTLVNHLLRHADGRRLAVLVNEFGDLPIDADLIEARADNLISIAGGCICCSFGSDLVAALLALKERTDIDQIAIETSGVALPGSIVQAMALLPGLDIDGVIVVVDAETIEQRSRDPYMSDTVLRQLADADLVLLNKIDLMAESQAGQIATWLAAQAPRARIVPARNAKIPIDVALGLQTDRRGARGSAKPHDASQYDSFSVEIVEKLDVARLVKSLADPQLGLLRGKGFVRDRHGQRLGLQVVGSRVDVLPANADTGTPALVFIGLIGQLDRDAILSAIAAAKRETTDR